MSKKLDCDSTTKKSDLIDFCLRNIWHTVNIEYDQIPTVGYIYNQDFYLDESGLKTVISLINDIHTYIYSIKIKGK